MKMKKKELLTMDNSLNDVNMYLCRNILTWIYVDIPLLTEWLGKECTISDN